MKIGIISDIHSNVLALKRILKELKEVDIIFCAGDITGYNTSVNEVFEEIRKKNIQCILGNHDAYLLGIIPVRDDLIVINSVKYTKKVISKKNFDYLKKIGKSNLDIEIDNLKIQMYHGSPWNHFEEYIYSDYKNFNRFREIDADLIILGHTHWPMIKKIGEKIIVNPGSCGQPRDFSKKPSFVVFNTKTRNVLINRIEAK